MIYLQWILNIVVLGLMVQKYWYQIKKIRKHEDSSAVSLKYHRDSFLIYGAVLTNAIITHSPFNIAIAILGIIGSQLTIREIKETR